MIGINIKIENLAGVTKAIAAAAPKDFTPVMNQIGAQLKRITATAFRSQSDPTTGAAWPKTGPLALATRPGGGGAGKALRDTGVLFQSINGTPPVVTATSVSIGSNLIYAGIHQTGGTIRPRNSKFLAIPLTREARKAGSARRWLDQRKAAGKPGFFAGRAIMGYEDGKGTKGYGYVAHWALVSSVTIRARPYLGYSERDAVGFLQLIEQFVLGRVVSLLPPETRAGWMPKVD